MTETGVEEIVPDIGEEVKRGRGRPRTRPERGGDEAKRGPGRPGGPKAGELYRQVSEAIMGAGLLPPFPVKYKVLEPERGARVPIIVAPDDSVLIVRAQALAVDIMNYCHKVVTDPAYAFTARQAREAADAYLGLASPTPSEAVKIVRWSDEPGLTYRRLPWVRGDGLAPCPTWEKLLSRMSNASAFIDWVGSLLFADSAIQQYVFLYGLGGDGKGSINRYLAKVFGTSYRSKQPPAKGDKFWSHGVLGARLVVFPDCNDTAFVASGLFKSLTGGDPIDVEAKGEMSFTASFLAKYLVIANERPMISSQKSDTRRIIFCEMESTDEDDPEFEKRLWEEGGEFLSACVANYERNYPLHGPIKSDNAELIGWVDTIEEDYQESFAAWFVLDPDGSVVPGQMQKHIKERWPKEHKRQIDFLRFLERTHGVRKKSVKANGHVVKSYKGISLKPLAPFGNSRADLGG